MPCRVVLDVADRVPDIAIGATGPAPPVDVDGKLWVRIGAIDTDA